MLRNVAILIVLLVGVSLSGCGIKGSINKTTTITDVNGTVTVNHCEADYINSSWGSSEGRAVSGCDAEGSSSGVDNSAMVALPIAAIQALAGVVK